VPCQNELSSNGSLNLEFDSISTFVDVGPGNGLHSVTLLRRLSSTASWRPSQYFAIDYSRHMADLAKRNVKRLIRGIEVSSILHDIETAFMDASPFRPNVFDSIYVLLGNTIGNVESISQTIKGVRSLAGSGARLLIGCALFEKFRSTESHLKPYQMNTYRDCVLHPLRMIGVPRRTIAFSVEFDSNTKTISTLARLREDFQASILDDTVTVKAGSTIRCALSRRFLPGEIPSLLEQLNVTVLGMTEDLPNGHGTYCAII
jgi:uncharacterized SAM-dependent methyltransferase